jgi:hypothetical protein
MRGKRKKGIKLSTRIVKGAMRRNVLELFSGQPLVQAFKASPGWMKQFMGRWRITWRRRNDNAKKSAEEVMPAVAKFINRLRVLRQDHPSVLVEGPPCAPSYFFNFFSFGTQRVWIKSPGSGLDKRQCTLQLLVRPLGKQPLPCLLFRGQPVPTQAWRLPLRNLEEELYDKDVKVLWQAKAWADTETCVRWAEGPFGDFVRKHLGGGPSLVLADNLGAQQQTAFIGSMERFGPAGATHVWQPCDHHLGREYGRRMGESYDRRALRIFGCC